MQIFQFSGMGMMQQARQITMTGTGLSLISVLYSIFLIPALLFKCTTTKNKNPNAASTTTKTVDSGAAPSNGDNDKAGQRTPTKTVETKSTSPEDKLVRTLSGRILRIRKRVTPQTQPLKPTTLAAMSKDAVKPDKDPRLKKRAKGNPLKNNLNEQEQPSATREPSFNEKISNFEHTMTFSLNSTNKQKEVSSMDTFETPIDVSSTQDTTKKVSVASKASKMSRVASRASRASRATKKSTVLGLKRSCAVKGRAKASTGRASVLNPPPPPVAAAVAVVPPPVTSSNTTTPNTSTPTPVTSNDNLSPDDKEKKTQRPVSNSARKRPSKANLQSLRTARAV